MKKLSTLFALSLLLALPMGAFAQDDEEVEKDLLEVAIFGGLAIPSGGLSDWTVSEPDPTRDKEDVMLGAKSGFDMGFEIGYFLSANMVLGLNFTYTQMSVDNESIGSLKHRLYNPSLYYKYYFSGESNLMPYAKVHAGIDNIKFTTRVYDGNSQAYEFRELSYEPVFAAGAGLGLFYYTHDYGGLFIEGNFHHAFSENATADHGVDDHVFGETSTIMDIKAGLTVFFGSD